MPDKLLIAQLIEALIILGGLIVLWRQGFSLTARSCARMPQPLRHWDIPGYVYALSVIRVLGVTFIFHLFVFSMMTQYAPSVPLTEGIGFVIGVAALPIGVLLGLAIGWFFLKSNRLHAHLQASLHSNPPLPSPLPGSQVIAAGIATFAAIMAAVTPVMLLWSWLLTQLGQSAEPQLAVQFYANTEPTYQLVLMTLLAVIVVPIAEELLFRKGFFRYLRGRVPRFIALATPALIFALAHDGLASKLPLLVFALIQAIAYERTGRIAVPIIAHALYNLHTALFIMTGSDPYSPLLEKLAQ